ncbi:MAG: GWxTD domain-containing protein [Bacteroidota bacterium]
MKTNPGYKTILFFLLLIGIAACGPQKIVKIDRNLSYIYNPGTSPLNPRYVVFHDNENTSNVTGKIFPNELLFNQANPENELQARLEIRYELYELDDEGQVKNLNDSARFRYTLRKEAIRHRFFMDMTIPAIRGRQYLLKIFTHDLQRRTSTQNIIYVDKRNAYSEQNFRVIRSKSSLLLFNPFIIGSDAFNIHYPYPVDSLYVLYYPKEEQLPRPIFYEASSTGLYERPDSIWKIANEPFQEYTYNEEGLYYLQADTSINEGISLLAFGESFPKITTPELMLGPTAYITTSVEFRELSEQKNLKLAIDNFWLDKTNNVERARELIRIYYNRVYFANYYFTNYIEGWKTDQGMIYIIYGPPDSIEKDVDKERWIYYKKNTTSPISFTFRRTPNRFSDMVFTLQRSESYNISWRQAVDSWRDGEVFLLD